ncbi:MAG: AAA family ATPase [Chitinivibrionales bacterium]|nr:AAA family ATPase [Chitinivibrionales bacterium]
MINTGAPGCVTDKIPLNDVQKQAVLYSEGPELVFAGAGTGKTRVLTAKIAFLIQEKGVYPNRIFSATFTNKAAREMRERVESLVGIPCDSLWIGTFHSLCVRILRREAPVLGYKSSFTIYDRDDQKAVIKKVLKELDIEERSIPPKRAIQAIARFKNQCMRPAEAENRAGGFCEEQIARIYRRYTAVLSAANAMDFDDLITNTVYLFTKEPAVRKAYQQRFSHILVDEYQDTNNSQLHFVKNLAGSNPNVFAVGDDDQSIYGWRGANVENILNFDKHFANTKIFMLEQNYRSTNPVLDFANALIVAGKKRSPKKLWCTVKTGTPVQIVRYEDDRQEASVIYEQIQKLGSTGIKPGSVCVLFRTNAQSRAFEAEFRKRNLPYVLVGAMSFYERKEIKDCCAYLRLVINRSDDVAFERIMNTPARGLGDKSKQALQQLARKTGKSMLETVLTQDLSQLGARAQKGFESLKDLFSLLIQMNDEGDSPQAILEQVLEGSGYLSMLEKEDTEESRARIENINELHTTMGFWKNEQPGKHLGDFLEEVSLATDVDKWEKQEGAVNLMTLHCAKGLEFDAVFIAGCEEGIVPSALNFEDPQRLEEERRLLYVGATRARKILQCSFTQQRWRFGSVMTMEKSRYLDAIPPGLYSFTDRGFGNMAVQDSDDQPDTDDQSNHDDTGEFSQETVQYRLGQFVVHEKYGRGKIVNLSGFGGDLRLTVLFDDRRRRRLIARAANLSPA